MSIDTITERLAEILVEIDGIKRADGARPRMISGHDIPAFMILTGPAENDRERSMDDEIYTTRTYQLVLMVKPWVDGREFDAEIAVRPFIEKVNTAFWSRPGLGNPKGIDDLDTVQDTWLSGDSGVIAVELNKAVYAGCQWALTVTQILPRTFAEPD